MRVIIEYDPWSRLGNRMFQYAFAYLLSKQFDCELFYNEGLAFIKSPHLYNIGKEQHDIKFRGEQKTHVLTLNCPLPTYMMNKPSPTGSLQLAAISGSDEEYAFITDVNIHDDNLNVIMRSSISRAVKKNTDDEFIIKLKKDY